MWSTSDRLCVEVRNISRSPRRPAGEQNYGQPVDWQATEMNGDEVEPSDRSSAEGNGWNGGEMNEVAWQDKGGCHEEEGGTQKAWQACDSNPKGIATFVYCL